MKRTKKAFSTSSKETVRAQRSANGEKSVWLFDSLDRDGEFAFDTRRTDFEHRDFLDKMISYSNMTWNEIAAQTHDEGRSKHHFLEYETLSESARKRIDKLELQEDTDCIFSFALDNKHRIVGLRENEFFHVKWYDSEHAFCPSKKKHT